VCKISISEVILLGHTDTHLELMAVLRQIRIFFSPKIYMVSQKTIYLTFDHNFGKWSEKLNLYMFVMHQLLLVI